MLYFILHLLSVLFAPALRPAGTGPPDTSGLEPESDEARPLPHDLGSCMGQTLGT